MITLVYSTTIKDFQKGKTEDTYLSLLNLFFLVKTSMTKIDFEYNGRVYEGTIEEVENQRIKIRISQLSESQSRRGNMRFEILNRYYFAEFLILAFYSDGAIIRFPKSVSFLARRKFTRFVFDDLNMRFIILYSPIFEKKHLEKNLESRFGLFMQEILQDNPSIRIIYNIFLEEITKISRDFEFRMIYKKDPEEFNEMEKILVEKEKPFFIHDTSRLEYYIEPPGRDNLINYSDYFEKLKLELEKRKALAAMDHLKRNDMRGFIVSYLAVPFFMFGDLIGYLYIYTNQFDKYFITPTQAEEIYLATELFSYAITKIKIRNSVFNPKATPTRIVNISISGLLMEIKDEILYEYLQKHKRIKMQINIKGEMLEIFGEIVRNYHTEDTYFMGVLFFKSAPDDIKRLEDYIYSRKKNIPMTVESY